MKIIKNRIIPLIAVAALILSSLCGVMLTAFAQSNKFLSFAYGDFSVGREHIVISGLSDAVPETYAQYNVRAEYQSNHINLTPKVWAPGIGSAFYRDEIELGEDMSFSTFFSFDMQGPVNDGFVYVINSSSNSSPNSWASIGMSTSHKSVNVEFDTSNGGSSVGDKDANHIAVTVSDEHGLTGICYQALDADKMNLQDTRTKYAWIDFDGKANKLYVTVSYTVKRSDGVDVAFDFKNNSSENFLSETIGTNKVYTGFTSITYNTDSPKNINSWYFINGHEPIDTASDTYVSVYSLEVFAVAEDEKHGTVTVKAYDVGSNPVSGVSLRLVSSNGAFGTETVVTNREGTAEFEVAADGLQGSDFTVYAYGGSVSASSYFRIMGADRKLDIAYRDFSDARQTEFLTLSGLSDAVPNPYESYDVRAKINNGILRLTSKTNFAPVSGAAYFTEPVILKDDMSFSTYFSFCITPGTMSSDGFAFVMNESTNRMTAKRTSMAIPTEIPSLSVEFDTYYNADQNDPGVSGNNHIAVNINGDIGSTPENRRLSLSSVTLADGKTKYAWIDYDADLKTLTVTVSGSLNRLSGETLTVSELDLSGVFTGNRVYAGFTGEHYGSGENHDINSWYFDANYNPIDIRTANYIMLPTQISLEASSYDALEANITVEVLNYDGTPAVNEDVLLSSTNGSLAENILTTDSSGKAYTTLSGSDLTGAYVTASLSNGRSAGAVLKIYDDPMNLVAAYRDFDRISENDLLNLTGANYRAHIENAALVLTDDDKNETAGAFLKNKIALAEDLSFSTYFTFSIKGGAEKGDGLAFVIGNKYNTSGFNGVSGTASLSDNIAVEFDVYKNESHGDADANHIGYNQNGSVSSAAALSLSNTDLSDGGVKHAWIDYNGSDDTLTVTVSNSNIRNDGESLVVNSANIKGALTSNEVYVGFTASTGSVSAKHTVYSWYFDNAYSPIDALDISSYRFDYKKVSVTADKLIGIRDTSTVTVKLTDLNGAPVKKRAVKLTTDRGSLSTEEAVTDLNGEITFSYINAGSKAGEAEIKAVSSDGYIGTILLECLAASETSAQTISFAYDSFGLSGMNSLIRLSGNETGKEAKISDGVLKLTPNTGGHTAGAGYYKNKIALGGDYSFSTMFTFKVTPGSSAADGFTFTLNNGYNALNSERHSMAMPHVSNSISVEFDTYKNTEHNDPSDNHISIDIAGDPESCAESYKLDLTGSGIKIADGSTKYVWIDYDGAEKLFTVIISNSSAPENGKKLSVPLDLSAVLASTDVYAGFTAEHYGSGEQHNINSWYFNNKSGLLDINTLAYNTAAVTVTAKATAVSDGRVYIDLEALNFDGTPCADTSISVFSNSGMLENAALVTDAVGRASTYLTGSLLAGTEIKAIAQGGAFGTVTVNHLGIRLKGEENVTVNLGDAYSDAGAAAYDLTEGDLTSAIKTEGTVDTSRRGVYEIKYSVKNSAGETASAVRRVTVADCESPVLRLLGSPEITIEGGIKYIDAGAVATDGYDGDITAEIYVYGNVDVKKPGVYLLTFEVADYSGNKAQPVYRTVTVVDTTAPVITLNGDETVYIEQYDIYEDEGATASDNVDKAFYLNRRIAVSGSVNTDVLGTYTLTYTVSDDAGNAAVPVIRRVIVVKQGELPTDSIIKTGDKANPLLAAAILLSCAELAVLLYKKIKRGGIGF